MQDLNPQPCDHKYSSLTVAFLTAAHMSVRHFQCKQTSKSFADIYTIVSDCLYANILALCFIADVLRAVLYPKCPSSSYNYNYLNHSLVGTLLDHRATVI